VNVTRKSSPGGKKSWAPRESEYGSGRSGSMPSWLGGALRRADEPRRKGEKEQYADI